jgi:amino acid transporter
MPPAVSDDDHSRNGTSGPEPGESPKERVDRELIELLNGLRVILPGVQVLLAFLLTVPFSSGYAKATSTERFLFFSTVIVTVCAIAALTMPAAYHRIRFREGDKERMLLISNAFAVAGLGLLAVATSLVVLLVTDVLYGMAVAVPIAFVMLLVLGGAWFVVPLWRKFRDELERGNR